MTQITKQSILDRLERQPGEPAERYVSRTDIQAALSDLIDMIDPGVRITVSAVPPANPAVAQLWVDHSGGTGVVRIYDGLAWQPYTDGASLLALGREVADRTAAVTALDARTTAAIAAKADQSALDGVSKRVTDGLAAEAQARAAAVSGAAATLHQDLTAGLADKADKSVKVVAGDGLSGGGALTADVNIGVKAGGISTAMLGDKVVTAAKAHLTAADVGAAPAGIVVANGTVTLDRGKPLLVVHPASGATVPVLLPPAAQAEGVTYTVVNDGDGAVDFPGQPGWAMHGKGHLLIFAAGGAWHVLDGAYTDRSVGWRRFGWDSIAERWQMVGGDTGVRDVTSLIDPAVLVSNPTLTATIRRIGATVEILVSETAPGTATGTKTLLTLPSGLVPREKLFAAVRDSDSGAQASGVLYVAGNLALIDMQTSVRHRAFIRFNTVQHWPTTLPGTQVTAPTLRSIAPPTPGDTWDDGGVIAADVNTPWVGP